MTDNPYEGRSDFDLRGAETQWVFDVRTLRSIINRVGEDQGTRGGSKKLEERLKAFVQYLESAIDFADAEIAAIQEAVKDKEAAREARWQRSEAAILRDAQIK